MSDEKLPVLRRADLDRVIRRAAELQFQEPDASDRATEGMSEDEILRIGSEVGLEASHLRRALGELRAEALMPSPVEESGLSTRLFGPSRVQAARALRGSVAEVSPRLHNWLRDRESLTPLRERAGSSVWEPNQGISAQLQRGFKWGGHTYEFAQAKTLEVSVVPLEEGWVLVTLVADLSNVRFEHGMGWGMGMGLGSAGLGIGIALVSAFPPAAVVALAAGAAMAGAGASTAASRRTLAPARARMALSLEGLLDRIERGELEPRAQPRTLGRLMRGLDEL
jgi:hypothetical protein